MSILDSIKNIGGELSHTVDNNIANKKRPKSSDQRTYTVNSGDTLSAIAKQY